MKTLFVGLNNAGSAYANTRHNVGLDCLTYLAEKHNGQWQNKKIWNGDFCSLAPHFPVEFFSPGGYINQSGISLAKRLKQWDNENSQIVLLFDEMDLEPGSVKLRVGEMQATHNGLKNIAQFCKIDTMIKLRIGIGRPKFQEQNISYLLAKPSVSDQIKIEQTYKKVNASIQAIINNDWNAVNQIIRN